MSNKLIEELSLILKELKNEKFFSYEDKINLKLTKNILSNLLKEGLNKELSFQIVDRINLNIKRELSYEEEILLFEYVDLMSTNIANLYNSMNAEELQDELILIYAKQLSINIT